MNPMMEALQRSRQDNPVSSSGTDAPMAKPGMGGDLAKYWQMMQDMNSKLDKLMALIGGNEPEKTEQENKNGKPGSGY